MERILSILKSFKDIFWFIVVFVLLVIIYFKNGAINNLREEVSKKPKVEFVYNHTRDTITDSIPTPYEVVKWKKEVVIETDTVPMELSQADSAQITEAYIKLYGEFNETVLYQDTLKNDSLAFIQINQSVTRNRLFNQQLIYEDRTPIVYITPAPLQEKTWSMIGGIETTIGTNSSMSLGAGVVTSKNKVFTFSYDPITQQKRGTIYLPIFNIKR